MENRILDNSVGHGQVLSPSDSYITLNWTNNFGTNVSTAYLQESGIGCSHLTLSPLGMATATLVAFFLSSRGSLPNIKQDIKWQCLVPAIFLIIFLIFTSPIMFILAFYRVIVFSFLKIQSSSFISLMEGSDAIWNMGDNSQPVINVLAEIEAEDAELLMRAIRESMLKACLTNPKLIWKKMKSCLGFSYWESCCDFSSLKDQVHWMPRVGKGCITSLQLQELISNLSSQALSRDNYSWEILISKQKLVDKESSKGLYPVLFRVHHSLGDGVSLLQLLLNNICSTKREKCQCDVHRFSSKNNENMDKTFNAKKYSGLSTPTCPTGTESMYNKLQSELRDSRETNNVNKNSKARPITEIFISNGRVRLESKSPCASQSSSFSSFSFYFNLVSILLKIQTMFSFLNKTKKRCELSMLDVNENSGSKLLAWYSDDSQGHLFSSIKSVKSQVKKVKFTDIFLTALSGSIEKFLISRKAYVPKCISVIIPLYSYMKQGTKQINLSSERKFEENRKSSAVKKCLEDFKCENLKLQNSFSVAVLNLPLRKKDIKTSYSHLRNVAKHMDSMYKSGQYAVNSFILKWIAYLVPEPLLLNFLQQFGHNTLVISNLVGPTNILYFSGYPLRNIYFWVPHRGNTGVSVSILSYCNRLQLGIMVDKVITNDISDVQNLLNEVVPEIKNLVDQCARNQAMERI